MLGSTLALNAGLISMIIGQLHPEVGADGVYMMGFETRLLLNANENYPIIFPPSTQWVTSHAKGESASWPIARSRYAGADFTAGVDVSWYKNHVNSNSMFAWNYTDDFFAGYDHGRQAGSLSVADHHIVPGKKFWTWGSGPRGRMWDDILTDTDGPYVELMVGAYSDNQPDYSWLQPFTSARTSPAFRSSTADRVNRKCVIFSRRAWIPVRGGTSARSLQNQHETAPRRQRDVQLPTGG